MNVDLLYVFMYYVVDMPYLEEEYTLVKVMLVDDEPFVRVAIKTLFDWEDNGFEIIEEANNGESALLKLNHSRPDLIITDIKMPIRDGIELIREVGRLYPSIKCVVLSNYDDFELTRSAFLEGAIDYILKNDLTKSSFSALVRRLKKKFFQDEQIRSRQTEQEEPRIIANDHASIIRELIAGGTVPPERLTLFSGSLPYVICVIKRGHGPGVKGGAAVQNGDNAYIVRNTVLKIISEISEFETYGYVDNADKCILIVCRGELDDKSFFEKLDAFLLSLCHNIFLYINTEASAGVSELQTDIAALPNAYRQAEPLSENGFYNAGSAIYYYHSAPEPRGDLKAYVNENLKRLTGYVAQSDWANICQIFTRMADLAKQSLYHPHKFKRLVINLMFLTQREMFSRYSENKDWLDDNEIFDQILQATELPELEALVKTYLAQLQQKSLSVQIAAGNYPPIVEQSLRYLHQHYRTASTNLNTVAKAVSVNRSYLSRLFLKETGVHFNTYLSGLRLACAKEMLSGTKDSIQAISERAGYGNAKYFISLFKRQEGMTPTAYRLRLSGGDKKEESL